MTINIKSFSTFPFIGMALDPIHIGTGGARLGRVDNTIVRDPVTRIPKIPGSSIAGVMRAYTAMAKGKYPDCAGIGKPNQSGGVGHCGKPDCPVCTVFGFAKGTGESGGFAGLAAFSDMHVLLFPVASQNGPQWITCPMELRQSGITEFSDLGVLPEQQVIYRNTPQPSSLNLGWLFLEVKSGWNQLDIITKKIKSLGIPDYINANLAVVSDKLFTHIVNSNLEVRTSVAIDPATGAAKEGALFTYEALPRMTVLSGELTCRNPKHFKINNSEVEAAKSPEDVKDVVNGAFSYLEHLGIGGMGSRGMGRMKVLDIAKAEKEGH
ncbi:type III-B CRISPR module RAMP protein Cmr4 [Myxococcota bacterium]|nr:type III-B CRISPR module RAMP protein Cmr4 [Myxococcota bacterium]MBU1379623.1 type III-B CRISPR module RAMP protein Cmr4 [Myxococcota bacterium]MBU1497222.1 type III-B CRISPR module RAMP protein Cmr4 [Myxococcota bacterium]